MHDLIIFGAGAAFGATVLCAALVYLWWAIDRLGDEHEWVGL